MTASAGVLRNLTAGFIYFVQCGDRPFVKIGWATNPQDRLTKLQCGTPDELKILALLDGTMTDELAWRRRFAHLCFRGEWFNLTAELADAIERREEIAAQLLADRQDPQMPETWRRYKEHLTMRRSAARTKSSTLNEEMVRAIRLDRRTVRAIAAFYGVSKTCIQDIRMRRTWHHVA
jgi:hypothetical protein